MSAAAVEQLSLPNSSCESAADLDFEYLRATTLPGPSDTRSGIQVVDLFAGCGGLTLGALEGARRSGADAGVALGADADPVPLAVMAATLQLSNERTRVVDLGSTLRPLGARTGAAERELLSPVARGLLLAGPPCQGHSALNNHTRHDDPRNDLYVTVARAARLLEPNAVIVENVRGVGSDRRRSVERCAEALEGEGYHVTTRRLNLLEIGAAQRRVRHLLVATRRTSFTWLLPTLRGRDVRWAIEDIQALEGTSPLDIPSKVSPENARRIAWLFDNDEYDLPNNLRPLCHQSDHSYRSMYGRLRWDAPAQTVTSGFGSMGQGRYVHPSRPRTLTPHEAARLQFLPDFVDFSTVESRGALATMIGNVAPPVLTIALVQALLAQKLL